MINCKMLILLSKNEKYKLMHICSINAFYSYSMHIYSDFKKQIKTKENIYRLEEKLQSLVRQIALENMKKLNIFTLDIF